MLEIKRIFPEDYPSGKRVLFSYESDFYYDVSLIKSHDGWDLSLQLKPFEETFTKYVEEEWFEDYKNAEYYVALKNGEEVGVLSLTHEKWNSVLRIWDIHVDKRAQRQGIGGQLIDFAISRARELGARAVVLESQTSNVKAIHFYMKKGFSLIGIDTLSYSNHDIQKKEVRIEMGYTLL